MSRDLEKARNLVERALDLIATDLEASIPDIAASTAAQRRAQAAYSVLLGIVGRTRDQLMTDDPAEFGRFLSELLCGAARGFGDAIAFLPAETREAVINRFTADMRGIATGEDHLGLPKGPTLQ